MAAKETRAPGDWNGIRKSLQSAAGMFGNDVYSQGLRTGYATEVRTGLFLQESSFSFTVSLQMREFSLLKEEVRDPSTIMPANLSVASESTRSR